MNIFFIIVLFFASINADACTHRSHTARLHFERGHPCPATGLNYGSCPGYIIDHRIALCVGGIDAPENMRWQTKAAAKAKDKWECKPGWEVRLEQCEQTGCFVNQHRYSEAQ